jgi:hypothetical protein
MTDEEFLEAMELKAMQAMFSGCLTLDHLGYKKYDTGCWSVGLRADQLSRLIDLARSKHETCN